MDIETKLEFHVVRDLIALDSASSLINNLWGIIWGGESPYSGNDMPWARSLSLSLGWEIVDTAFHLMITRPLDPPNARALAPHHRRPLSPES